MIEVAQMEKSRRFAPGRILKFLKTKQSFRNGGKENLMEMKSTACALFSSPEHFKKQYGQFVIY